MSMPQLQNLGLSGRGAAAASTSAASSATATASCSRAGPSSAIFQPFCRNHSGEGTRAAGAVGVRRAVRERLPRHAASCGCGCCPYLYTLFEEAARTGAPILRPLLFEYPDDPTTYTADDEFLLGDALLVAPITRPGIEHRHVYLPAGTWVQWWTRRARSTARRTCSRTRRSAGRRSTRAPTRRSRCGRR